MKELVKQHIAQVLGITGDFDVSVPEVKEFGHYSTNLALRLAKERKMNPLDLATEFAAKLHPSTGSGQGGIFARAEAVRPGFINLWISDEVLAEQFTQVVSGKAGVNVGGGAKVVIDYSAPNIAKPMHVGHMRSTIIGDALANIYEAVGYKAVRWNYLGDWGTQFGKLIAAYKLWGNKKEVKEKPIETLIALYVRFHDEVKKNPELENQGRIEFKKLEDGDRENRKLWEWFKDESLIEFHKLFKRLGVKFNVEIGESFYEEALYDVLKELEKKKLLVPGDDESKIVNLDQFKLPVALIQKSDGASLYITRDIASLKHRLSKYKPAKILYVVANEQALHFSQLFGIAKLMGIAGVELEHIKFGMVLGADGKKLSTREGKAVKLEDVLNEITTKALEVIKKNNPDMKEKDQVKTAEIVGIGALKYNDLKENRVSDIQFNWDHMLDLHGDSAPYLQYTAVRLTSIIAKAGKIKKPDLKNVTDELKPVLMKKVIDYWDVVALCAETNLTSHLAKYLLELAKLGNQYYESVRILDDTSTDSVQVRLARRNGRLLLIRSVAETIKAGLELLGIQVPERI